MKAKKPPRQREFSLHWGRGVIEEEVQIETAYHRPTMLILDAADLPRLRRALASAPRLKKLLSRAFR